MSDFSSVAPQQSNLSQSQAFAAALQRAKQIAAKIQPNQAPQQGGGGGGGVGVAGGGGGGGVAFKRSHDDSDSGGPDSKRFTSPGSDYGHNNNSNMSSGGGNGAVAAGGASGATNMSQAIAQAAAVAARLAATAGTTCEEQIRIPDCIVNAFMGRGSNDTITHIQAESGCKVQLPQDSDISLADNVITLRGSRETVTKGREMMQQLASRNGASVEVMLTINMPPPGPTGYPPYQEIMIPGTKVGLIIGKGGDTIKQLQEKTGAKMVIIQDGPNQEVIKPLRISGEPQKIEHAKQLVLELIAQKDAQAQQQAARNSGMGGGSGGGGGGGYNNFGSGGESCEVFVPKIAVGVVIGKGGDMIRKIQTECGCKLQFIQGKNDEPGDRRCLIQGSRQQVEDAKRMIDGLIENMMQRSQHRNSNSNGGGGSGGGSSMDNGNSNYGYGYGVNHAQQPAREEITFMVPASKCGIVIGRGGETIKLINQQSGAYCEMDRNAVNPPSEKLFKCKGSSEQVEAARQMIAEKINMDLQIIARKPISGNAPSNQQQQQGNYNQNTMQSDPNAAYQQQWGGYAQQGGWGDPQAQHQQQQMAGMGQNAAAAAGGQQADYSTQWIEYYKSMGMHREAEMIEQQLKVKQATVGNAAQPMGGMAMQQQQQQQQPQQQQQQQQPQQQQPQQQPQPQQQQQQQQSASATGNAAAAQGQDYSAQWAEYYRSIGKIEEAEAIEKQMKQNQSTQGGNVAAVGGNTNSSNNPAAGGNAVSGVSVGSNGGGSGVSMQQPQPAGGYPQGMTASQYAQYSQYYAAAAAAGAGTPGGYPQQAYGGYGGPGGGYPGAPQPAGMPGSMGGGAGGGGGPGPNGQSKPHNQSDKN